MQIIISVVHGPNGVEWWSTVDCGYCRGEGMIMERWTRKECPRCHGSGIAQTDFYRLDRRP